MDNCAANDAYLGTSLVDDSKSLFDQWKRHLEFEYDFVKVQVRLNSVTTLGNYSRE